MPETETSSPSSEAPTTTTSRQEIYVCSRPTSPGAPHKAGKMKVLVPLFVHLEGEPNIDKWNQIEAATQKVSVVAIINPRSGPVADEGLGDAYKMVLKTFKQNECYKDSHLTGYVSTDYAKRDIEQVKRDIANYAGWAEDYRVDGLLFDQINTNPSEQEYYEELSNYTKEQFRDPNFRIVTAGAAGDFYAESSGSFTSNAGITFEDSFARWVTSPIDSYKNPENIKAAVLIYSCPARSMREAIDLAYDRSVEYVYVTERPNGVEWEYPPTYFDQEIDYIASLNKRYDY